MCYGATAFNDCSQPLVVLKVYDYPPYLLFWHRLCIVALAVPILIFFAWFVCVLYPICLPIVLPHATRWAV